MSITQSRRLIDLLKTLAQAAQEPIHAQKLAEDEPWLAHTLAQDPSLFDELYQVALRLRVRANQTAEHKTVAKIGRPRLSKTQKIRNAVARAHRLIEACHTPVAVACRQCRCTTTQYYTYRPKAKTWPKQFISPLDTPSTN